MMRTGAFIVRWGGDIRPTGQSWELRGSTVLGHEVGEHDIACNNTNRLSYSQRCATRSAIVVRAAAALEDAGGVARDQDIRA